MNAVELIDELCDRRVAFLEDIVRRKPKQGKFRKGWLAREARVRQTALNLVTNAEPQAPIETPQKPIIPVASAEVVSPVICPLAAENETF